MTYCPLCDMENCHHQGGVGARFDESLRGYDSTPGLGTGASIDARMPGVCANRDCRRPFDAGDRITYSRLAGGWVGECCA